MAELTQEELQQQVENLTATNAKLTADNAALSQENADLLKVNEELTLQVEALSAASPEAVKEAVAKAVDFKKVSFEVNGQIYGLNYPRVKLEGFGAVGAPEIEADEEIQQHLVSIGHPILQPQ